MNKNYQKLREEVETFFCEENLVSDSREQHISPNGNYCLTIDAYTTGPRSWEYTRGIVTRISDSSIVADIKRNFGLFWFLWHTDKNGAEYLLCGEDYQGQTVISLENCNVVTYFPESGFKGVGFCWTAAFASNDSKILAVEGCYWACPYEIVFYDFSKPSKLPYRELLRIRDFDEVIGWNELGQFEYTQLVENESDHSIEDKVIKKINLDDVLGVA